MNTKVLLPTSKPPTPSSIFNQSSFDRIRLLLSLSPRCKTEKKLGELPILFYPHTSSGDENISTSVNNDDVRDISLFGGEVSLRSNPKAYYQDNLQGTEHNKCSHYVNDSICSNSISNSSKDRERENDMKCSLPLSSSSSSSLSLTDIISSNPAVPGNHYQSNSSSLHRSKRKRSSEKAGFTLDSYLHPSSCTSSSLVQTTSHPSTPITTSSSITSRVNVHNKGKEKCSPSLSKQSCSLPTTSLSSSSSSSSSSHSLKSADFHGIGSYCRNAGSSLQSLQTLLSICDSTSRSSDSLSLTLTLSCLWSDMTSNHISTTSKHCTPSLHCRLWYCTCDRNIRIQQAYKPLLGVLISVTAKEEDQNLSGDSSEARNASDSMYFLPLAPCLNHKPHDWHPVYELNYKDYRIPLQSTTTVEERWSVLLHILSSDINKVIFHSQLFLLPVMAACEQRQRQRQRVRERERERERVQGDKEVIWESLLVNNIVDPQVAAHLIDSELTEHQLELQSLLGHFSILPLKSSDEVASDQIPSPFSSWGAGEELLGRVSRGVHTLQIEMNDVFRLHQKVVSMLESCQSLSVLRSLEMPLVPVLAVMELRGIPISVSDMSSLEGSIAQELDALTRQAHRLADREFNLASPEQVSGVLYDKLKLPAPAKTAGGRHASTSEEDLLRIADKHAVVSVILDFRTLSKISTTYLGGVKPFIYTSPTSYSVQSGITDDSSHKEISVQRVHCCWNQTAVRTGRLSCCRPNLQSFPKNITTCRHSSLRVNARNMFRSSPGCVLVAADYSQIEMRILAHMTADKELCMLFRREGDIYRHLASLILNKDVSTVDSAERERAKVICLGVIYGMGPQAAASKLGLDVPAVNKITHAFFEKFRSIKSWLQQIKA